MIDREGPWKELFEGHLPLALLFLRPAVFADVDWAIDHDNLEQELRKLQEQSALGKGLVDVLGAPLDFGGS